jgi:hypothetical protein
MNHWPFILAAYALTLAGSAGLGLLSFVAMRRAEREVEKTGRDR